MINNNKFSENILKINSDTNILTEDEKDFYIFVNNKNAETKRLIIIDESFLNKNKERIFNEIGKLSQFHEIDYETLKIIYFKCSGELKKVTSYFNNTLNLSDLWTNMEDEIILLDSLNEIEMIITTRGVEEVMKRRLFLKHIENFNEI